MKKILIVLFLFSSYLLCAQYYGKNKIQPEKNDWNYMQTMHFDIYYPADNNDFGRIIALCAEEAYYYIREDFHTPIQGRIPVIFYSTHQEFEVTNVIPNLLSEGVGGFTESMNNRIAMPFSGSYREMEKTLIHEMTHAYVNELSSSRNSVMVKRALPFWFSEGLPEFLSVHGEENYNNMFIMDLVLNNNLTNLNEVGGYYAYREGESFLTFIEKEYGRSKVMDMFYSIRTDEIDMVSKRLFDMEFLEIQKRWENYLKSRYFSIFSDYDIPYEKYKKLTDAGEDGSYMNTAPRFAPDGVRFTWFSNKNLTDGIWISDRHGIKEKKELIRTEVAGNLEEFHFKRNNVSWFPDGDRIAFTANTSFGDVIHILDVNTEEITESISFDTIQVIYEIDVSPDGNKIVFSGICNTKADIYIYDLESGKITRLLNDRFYEGHPRWSPNGKKMAFYSERIPLVSGDGIHLFDNAVRNIYIYDLESEKFYQITDQKEDAWNPVWNGDGTKLLYLSDIDDITNVHVVDITEAKTAQVTNTLSGVMNFDIDASDENMLISCFYEQAWDVYLHSAPLDSLVWHDHFFPRKIDLEEDFWEIFDIERIKFFGKTNLAFKKPGPVKNIDPELAKLYEINIDYGPDTTVVEENRKIDRKPTIPNEPEIKHYNLKWKLDNFWGGLAYNSSGTYALVNIWASDILGNHSAYGALEISGEIENSSLNLQYLNLTRRNDYGGGVFYLNDETIYQVLYTNGDYDYFRQRDREYGFFGTFIHPFDKYWRFETQLALLHRQRFRDWWSWSADTWIEEWMPEEFGLDTKEDDFVMAPRFNLIHDNTLYGSTGPISGGKQYFSFQHSFSTGESYNFAYLDIRKYSFFAKRFAWANRLIAGWTDTDMISGFELSGFNGVRGFDDDEEGMRKALISTEFRFPLIDNLSFAFPLPIRIQGVRGSAFIDLGAVWDEEKDFQFWHKNHLKNSVMGVGFGPRLNMGFFILKFDIAWQTDLYNASKPRYYLWLIEDF